MEEEEEQSTKWRFKGSEELIKASAFTIKGVVSRLSKNLSEDDNRPVISLGHGDPSASRCFLTTPIAEDAIVEAVRSTQFNSYAPNVGILPARRSVAEYLSRDLPYKLSPDDVYLTVGTKHAIQIILPVLAYPGANILLPKPGYPMYEAHAALSHLEVRHFDLLPEKGWEVDLDGLRALANDKTVAMVIINPGNPCCNVFTYEHLQKVAETARELGILVIADEVYGHLTFGNTQFVPMGVFASTVPIVTLGSISKRWIVPGWRLGWIVTSDPNGVLKKSGIVDRIKACLNVTSGPATFIQGAIPHFLANTTEDFFLKTLNVLREAADFCYDKLEEIPCITCPHKAEGSMFVMVKLNLSLLEGINDDMEFCVKLAKEESVIVLPGFAFCYSVLAINFMDIAIAIANYQRGSPNGAYSSGFRPITHKEFLCLTRARRRYWEKSYAGWRRFTAAQPGPAHIALSSLEKTSWINFMITQNVDRLHHSAGSNPLELHGTIYNVVCIDCSFRCYCQLFEDQLKALNPKVEEK